MNKHRVLDTTLGTVTGVHVFPAGVAWLRDNKKFGLSIPTSIVRNSGNRYATGVIGDKVTMLAGSILSTDYPHIATSCLITTGAVHIDSATPLVDIVIDDVTPEGLLRQLILNNLTGLGVNVEQTIDMETIRSGNLLLLRNHEVIKVDFVEKDDYSEWPYDIIHNGGDVHSVRQSGFVDYGSDEDEYDVIAILSRNTVVNENDRTDLNENTEATTATSKAAQATAALMAQAAADEERPNIEVRARQAAQRLGC
jgi:hypothetical protein